MAISEDEEILGYAWLFCKEKRSQSVLKLAIETVKIRVKNRVGTNLLKKVEQDTKDMGISKLTAVVESENEIAASVVKWLYNSGYKWKITEGLYVSLNQALEKNYDSIYLSKKI